MANNSDWLPGSRHGQITMARNWITVLTTNIDTGTQSGTISQAENWGIPDNAVTELSDLIDNADSALSTALNEDTRTPVATAKCKTAFNALVVKMRDIKKRWFYMPPLEEADLVSLGLNPPDTNPTPVGPPTTPVTVVVSYSGKNMLHISIVPITGYTYDDRADYGFRIFYGIMPPGGATPEQAMENQYLLRVPVKPEELNKSFFTRRKKDLMENEKLPYETSGMTCYICVRYENSKGDHGPWGTIVSAIIP